MLTYKHDEYEYTFNEENLDNLIEIRKAGMFIDSVQSPVSDLADAKTLQNTVMTLGID